MTRRLLIFLAPALALAAGAAYEAEINQFRQHREARLKAEDGWLTVAGLFWLHDGANAFGKDAGNRIPLPAGPAQAGTFELHDGKVSVVMGGMHRALQPDSSDVVQVDRLKLFVIKRGDRVGVRLKDPASEYRRDFHGLDYFPVRDEYRIAAKWVAAPRQIPILNIIGQTEPSECPGYAIFQLAGKEHKLYPILEDPADKELFFIFRDQTSGKETYGAGRFLYSDLPRNNQVVLDFNKAVNPPCAFTPYATCPLPPPENRLAVRIEAGEKKYGNH